MSKQADNVYAVWKNQDGGLFFNPNCYFTPHQVGDVVHDTECVFVGSLAECQGIVDAQPKDDANLFDRLFA